jgi:WXXGXW repeat (2 copies)
MKLSFLAGAVLAVSLVAGCVVPAINPNPPVPALLPDPMSKPPVTGVPLVWQPGHWDWTGSGYVWSQGEWVSPAGQGQLWMHGWWMQTPSGWAWQPPHWMS